jgi:endonuclease/exonuclease/phosphatase family metal-dependent hydrolase
MTVLTFNLCADCDMTKALSGDDGRMQWAGREIRRLHPDVVALQEVQTLVGDALGTIALGDYSFRFAGTTGFGKIGLAVLSRYDIDGTDLHPLPGRTRGVMAHALMRVTVRTPMGPVDVYTTHLTPDGVESEKRERQMAEVRRRVEAEATLNPGLLLADLNASDGTRAQAAAGRRWIDAFRAANPEPPSSPGFTWDREKNARISAGEWKDWKSARVDYIYAVPGAAAARVRVLESRLVLDRPDASGRPPSDHFGVLAVIEITRDPGRDAAWPGAL